MLTYDPAASLTPPVSLQSTVTQPLATQPVSLQPLATQPVSLQPLVATQPVSLPASSAAVHSLAVQSQPIKRTGGSRVSARQKYDAVFTLFIVT